MHSSYKPFLTGGRQMTASERRERAWSLVKSGAGSQDDQSKASGLTVSRIADYRRLWKYIKAEHPSGAESLSCLEALSVAKAHGFKTHR